MECLKMYRILYTKHEIFFNSDLMPVIMTCYFLYLIHWCEDCIIIQTGLRMVLYLFNNINWKCK